eukprot:730155-Pelagomonas_calceolata.AAC.1
MAITASSQQTRTEATCQADPCAHALAKAAGAAAARGRRLARKLPSPPSSDTSPWLNPRKPVFSWAPTLVRGKPERVFKRDRGATM